MIFARAERRTLDIAGGLALGGVLVFVAMAGRKKIIAVSHRLDEDEGAVKNQ